MISRLTLSSVTIGLLILAGCQQQTKDTMPPPVAMTEEAVGHFCQMNILEHAGPKAQIHLEGLPYPLFSVRFAMALPMNACPNKTIKSVRFTSPTCPGPMTGKMSDEKTGYRQPARIMSSLLPRPGYGGTGTCSLLRSGRRQEFRQSPWRPDNAP